MTTSTTRSTTTKSDVRPRLSTQESSFYLDWQAVGSLGTSIGDLLPTEMYALWGHKCLWTEILALWGHKCLYCGDTNVCIVGTQMFALWGHKYLQRGDTNVCIVGTQMFAMW